MKKYLKIIEIVLAVIIIISFFLPWIDFWWYVSGLQAPLLLMEWPAGGPAGGIASSQLPIWSKIIVYLFFIVYLIPIFSSLIIIQGIRKKKTIKWSLATGILIYLLLLYVIIAWPQIIFHGLLFGAWISLIAGLLLIITAILKNKFDNLDTKL